VSSILVTGAAGDLGSATAKTLAERGSRLVLADHPQTYERLQEVVEDCLSLGAEAVGTTCSVTDEAAVASAIESHEPFSGVVNSAGLQGEFVSVERYPLKTRAGYSRSTCSVSCVCWPPRPGR